MFYVNNLTLLYLTIDVLDKDGSLLTTSLSDPRSKRRTVISRNLPDYVMLRISMTENDVIIKNVEFYTSVDNSWIVYDNHVIRMNGTEFDTPLFCKDSETDDAYRKSYSFLLGSSFKWWFCDRIKKYHWDLTILNKFGEFIDAVKKGDVEAVEKLSRGEWIDKKLWGRCPLHWACVNGHAAVVRLLIDKGCETEPADKWGGWRPIHLSCSKGHANVVQLLLDKGCQIEVEDPNGWRPIHWACAEGRAAVVQLLTDRGCQMENADKDGLTPLDLARRYGKKECEKIITTAQSERRKDEFQLLHLRSCSVICRKYEIHDLSLTIDRIKQTVKAINRPIVICHLSDPIRLLSTSMIACQLICDELSYPEFVITDLPVDRDEVSLMTKKLRKWDINVALNEDCSEAKLKIKKPSLQSEWMKYSLVTLDVTTGDLVNVLFMDNTTGADIKATFMEFLTICCRMNISAAVDSDPGDKDGAIKWFNKLLMLRKQFFTFYDSDGQKLSTGKPIRESITGEDRRISVIHDFPSEKLQLIPPLSEDSWAIHILSNEVSQEYILIRCVTDDGITFAVSRNGCTNAALMKQKMSPYVFTTDMKGNLLLFGSAEWFTDDTKIEEMDDVAYYAVVSPYENVKKLKAIGGGSYGSVYKCEFNKKRFALKKLWIDKNEPKKQSYLSEILVASRVGLHPNIVKYHRFFETTNEFFILMDYMKRSLFAHLMENYPLNEDEIISIARQILQGLKHLHERKIIHRDLKCKNVLIDPADGSVKLCDFGISRCQIVDTDKAAEEGGSTTEGTMKFMAPEISLKYGQKADIWSFGATMVEMITGDEPYPDLNEVMAARRVRTQKIIKYSRERYSQQLHEFVELCLNPFPSQRPSCAQLLRREIFNLSFTRKKILRCL